jgi:micrococcal nuclease
LETELNNLSPQWSLGKEAKVEAKGQGRYGRTVADVILPDGRNPNRENVKAGFAWWFRKYAPHDTELEAMESEARQAKRGLWVEPDPVPPWEYRSEIRQGEVPMKCVKRTHTSVASAGIIGI